MYPPGLLSTCQNARMSARVLGTQVKSGAINLLTVPSSAVIRVVKGTSYVLGPMVYSRDRPNVHSMYVSSCLCFCLSKCVCLNIMCVRVSSVCEYTQGQTPPWDVIYEWSRLGERALNSRLNVTYLGKRTLCHRFVAIIGPILGLTSNVKIRTDIKIMYWSTHFVIKGGWFGCPLISYPSSLLTSAVKIDDMHIVDNEEQG